MGQETGRSVATIDVIIVTYNSADFVSACLDALADPSNDGMGCIVVDNKSIDETLRLVREHRLDARVIEAGGNLGYAAAINVGVEHSTADAVLILNPDACLQPGAITELCGAFNDRSCGIAAPQILHTDGTIDRSLRRFPSAARVLGQSVVGAERAGRHPGWCDVVTDMSTYQVSGRHDWSSGAAMLVSRACLDAVGAWDESFFLYSEETDFAWRARAAGYELEYVPEAIVVHDGGDSLTSPRLWSILVQNRVRVVRKHRGNVAGTLCWVTSVIGEAARSSRAKNRAALRALLTRKVDPEVLAARTRRPDWLVFAGQDWWYHNRAHSDFQLATRLAKSRNVLLVNAIAMRMPLPGRSTGAWRRIARKLASTAKFLRAPIDERPDYAVLSLVLLPFYGSAFFRRLNARLIVVQVRLAMKLRGQRNPLVLTTLPTTVDVLDRLHPPVVVFNRSDKHSAFEETNQPVIKAMEDRLLAESASVLYVSHHLLDEDAPLVGDRAHFLDHGVDLRHFRRCPESPELASIPHPRVGFFGGLDDYIVDFEILSELARARPDHQIVLIGDATIDLSELDALPNVHLLGFRPYETIPSFGSGFDVALMPWVDNEWIASCNPIKLKEYLALGLPIVTTDFPEVEPYRDIVTVASRAGFVAAVDGALAAAALDDGSAAAARRAAVLDASWDRRARQLRDHVEGLA